jgi:thiol-disulfide isomerase/thioredoxin
MEKAHLPPGRQANREPRCVSRRHLVLSVLIASLSVGCGDDRPPRERPVPRPRTSGIASSPLVIGDRMPKLEAEGWLNGDPPAPDAPGVRLVVVDAWGIWCPFCALTAPGQARLQNKYADQGVVFVSITNLEREVVEHYIGKHSVTWSNGYGASAQMIAALGAGSGMPGPSDYEVAPTLYLVGPDGRIRWVDGRGRAHFQEPSEWEKLVDDAIKDALTTPAKPAP